MAKSTSFLVGALTIAATLAFLPSSTPTLAADPVLQAPAREELWNVIYLAGQRIGYSQTLTETIKKNGNSTVRTSLRASMSIKRFGQTLVMNQSLTTEETLDGDMLQFRLELANPPAAPSITLGKIDGKNLVLTTEVNGKPKTVTQPWHVGVKSPAYQDRLLKQNPLKEGDSRTFESFFPEFLKVGKVTLKGAGYEETSMYDNTRTRLFKVRSTHTLLPGSTTDSYLDDLGETQKTSSSLLGTAMEMYLVSQAEAMKRITGKELDLAVNTLVEVKPILNPHDTKKIVYNLTITDQDPMKVVPTGETQTLKKINDDTAEMTVVSLAIPETARPGKVANEFLESSQYLQRDDKNVKRHADAAAGDATNAAEITRRMEKYVHEKLESKNFSTAMASAAEVAEKMEGDCTEHAVLLAAMLRAKSIPSRVVVGLVYADRLYAFGGHMWTEANLEGHWIPLDATLGKGGIGAAHIRLADASLSDDGPPAITGFASLMTVIGHLKLNVVSIDGKSIESK